MMDFPRLSSKEINNMAPRGGVSIDRSPQQAYQDLIISLELLDYRIMTRYVDRVAKRSRIVIARELQQIVFVLLVVL